VRGRPADAASARRSSRRASSDSSGARSPSHWREAGLVCEIAVPADQLALGPERPTRPAPGPEAAGAAAPPGGLVLVVEDEALIALQIEEALKSSGREVLGPAASVAEAARLIEAAAPQAALLDVNLGTERSYPVADVLRARGTPFAFCTGYAGADDLPERFRDVPRLPKPLGSADLARAVERLLAGAPAGAGPLERNPT
jgi:CheY-like chemotaxis protein